MSQPKLPAPLMELLTQEEIHAALVRAVLSRHVQNPDALLQTVDARVAHRFIRLADGGQAMVAAVVVLGTRADATPTPPEGK